MKTIDFIKAGDIYDIFKAGYQDIIDLGYPALPDKKDSYVFINWGVARIYDVSVTENRDGSYLYDDILKNPFCDFEEKGNVYIEILDGNLFFAQFNVPDDCRFNQFAAIEKLNDIINAGQLTDGCGCEGIME